MFKDIIISWFIFLVKKYFFLRLIYLYRWCNSVYINWIVNVKMCWNYREKKLIFIIKTNIEEYVLISSSLVLIYIYMMYKYMFSVKQLWQEILLLLLLLYTNCNLYLELYIYHVFNRIPPYVYIIYVLLFIIMVREQ